MRPLWLHWKIDYVSCAPTANVAVCFGRPLRRMFRFIRSKLKSDAFLSFWRTENSFPSPRMRAAKPNGVRVSYNISRLLRCQCNNGMLLNFLSPAIWCATRLLALWWWMLSEGIIKAVVCVCVWPRPILRSRRDNEFVTLFSLSVASSRLPISMLRAIDAAERKHTAMKSEKTGTVFTRIRKYGVRVDRPPKALIMKWICATATAAAALKLTSMSTTATTMCQRPGNDASSTIWLSAENFNLSFFIYWPYAHASASGTYVSESHCVRRCWMWLVYDIFALTRVYLMSLSLCPTTVFTALKSKIYLPHIKFIYTVFRLHQTHYSLHSCVRSGFYLFFILFLRLARTLRRPLHSE